MKHNHKILFVLAIAMAIASWVIALYHWGILPAVIPTHFGFSGQADAWSDRSLLSVFLMPFLQSLILAMFVFLYYKPQYSDMPTTLWLTTLDKKSREHAFGLIRTMMVGMALWIGLLFTYITYGVNAAALNPKMGLSPSLLLAIIGLMLAWIVYWTIMVYRATKIAVQSNNDK